MPNVLKHSLRDVIKDRSYRLVFRISLPGTHFFADVLASYLSTWIAYIGSSR